MQKTDEGKYPCSESEVSLSSGDKMVFFRYDLCMYKVNVYRINLGNSCLKDSLMRNT